MAIVNSYVSLPEGGLLFITSFIIHTYMGMSENGVYSQL